MKFNKTTFISILLVVLMVFGYFQVLSGWMVGVCAVEPDQTDPSESVEQSTTEETTVPEETDPSTTQPTTTTPEETDPSTTQPTTTTPEETDPSTTQPTTVPEQTDPSTSSTTPSDTVTYTVVFLDWDGSVISSAVYAGGETVVVPADPQRADKNGYSYTFSGWDKEIDTVCVADAAYTAQYTATQIVKSSDNTLKKLTVSNATISPAFDPKVTNYTATVPFSTTKLNLSATANHAKATVKTSGNNLVPGGKTKVTVTVTAENGSIKTYTITVTRQADPDYVASANNNLSGIRVGGFQLSPSFDPDVTSYVLWLPYETDSLSVTGLTEDSKASAYTEGGETLIAGADNEIKVICVAENGEEKVYTIIAKRAAPNGSESTQPTTAPTTATTAPSTTEHVCPTVPNNHVCETGNNIPIAMVVIPWILAFAALIALLVVLLLPKTKK